MWIAGLIYNLIYDFPGSNYCELLVLSGEKEINLNRILSWLELAGMIYGDEEFYHIDDE